MIIYTIIYYYLSSKLTVINMSGYGDDISDILYSSDKLQEALKSNTKVPQLKREAIS